MREKAGVLKEEVRNMIKGSHDVPEIVDLIITLQRLNLDYHYEDEITEKLTVVYNSNYDGGNLDLVSRRFYLLRKCGYHVSSGEPLFSYALILEYIYMLDLRKYTLPNAHYIPSNCICMQMYS
jgi:hypothetical protein